MAATVEARVVDERGRGISQVAVYVTPQGSVPITNAPRAEAIMDQHNNEFVPHMLVVQAGTQVLFPNSDVVSHHVYSFSPTKTFELGLYKGNAHPPLEFDDPGVVVLGCNIHDSMLGYILVVDTPYFALTDENGAASIAGLPAGNYTVEVWTPRARPSGLPEPRSLSLPDGASSFEVQVTGRLAPEHDQEGGSLSWKRY